MAKDTALVVPSIREESFARFIKEWASTGLFDRVDLILMEDNPARTFSLDLESGPLEKGNHVHLCWEDIDAHEWGSAIIPRRSDTVRSYAYWFAYQQGYEYLMTLDDDCYPSEGFEMLDLMHKAMLDRTRWFNTLNSVRPRGVPYGNLGRRICHINHGIWKGVLDYDAPQQLVNPIPEVYSNDSRIVPWGSYHPFCGMNAIWRREAMVLSYHLLMGSMKNSAESNETHRLPFDRFGDIWCGIIQKKICDALHWSVSTGVPYIHHDRASNPFTNLRKEANGIEVNEWFWQAIDMIPLATHWSASDCYKAVGEAVGNFGKVNTEHDEYWRMLGAAMISWADLFE